MKYIYGPVPSRRLKRSLGIDLIPMKVCSFSCIYCQLGRTRHLSVERKKYVPEDEVIMELKQSLRTREFDYITLSGSGEPTLFLGIDSLVNKIKGITDKPVALLTNGSLFHITEVRREVKEIDVILPSLDAYDERSFKLINRPHPSIEYRTFIHGLIKLREEFSGKIFLEIMLIKDYNDSKEAIMKFKELIGKINPDLVHLNTVVRPPAEEFAKPLKEEELRRIKEEIGEIAHIITTFHGPPGTSDIIETLERRPMTLEDIVHITGKDEKEVREELDKFLKVGKIIKKGKYYKLEEG